MTGQEFCELLELDYNEIVESRTKECQKNLNYFLLELIKIKSVKKCLLEHRDILLLES